MEIRPDYCGHVCRTESLAPEELPGISHLSTVDTSIMTTVDTFHLATVDTLDLTLHEGSAPPPTVDTSDMSISEEHEISPETPPAARFFGSPKAAIWFHHAACGPFVPFRMSSMKLKSPSTTRSGLQHPFRMAIRNLSGSSRPDTTI